MDATYTADPAMVDLGLLVVRLVVGLLMAAHGSQKLFGWFGGYGPAGTGQFFEQLGFRPGKLFALAAGFGETLSGLLVTLGFLGPAGPALMISVMIVAAVSVHWAHGVFAANNGIEMPLLYATIAFGLALIGFGRWSLDAQVGITPLLTPGITWTVLGLGILGGVLNLMVRRPPQPAQAG